MEKKNKPLILCIESSTTNCSVGLVKGEEVLELFESNEGYSHAENIAVFINDALKRQKVNASELSAVAIGKGPGSYTGLRIGTAIAKGICYASSIPLLAINSLEIMAAEVLSENKSSNILLPMLDARRMEVYSATYDPHLNEIEGTRAIILDESSFKEYRKKDLTVFGPGASKFVGLGNEFDDIKHFQNVFPSVRGMRFLVSDYYDNQRFEDLAYFEPFYLKDFVAGPPKKIV